MKSVFKPEKLDISASLQSDDIVVDHKATPLHNNLRARMKKEKKNQAFRKNDFILRNDMYKFEKVF